MDGAFGKNNSPGDRREFTEHCRIGDVDLLTGADDMDVFFPVHGSVSGMAG